MPRGRGFACVRSGQRPFIGAGLKNYHHVTRTPIDGPAFLDMLQASRRNWLSLTKRIAFISVKDGGLTGSCHGDRILRPNHPTSHRIHFLFKSLVSRIKAFESDRFSNRNQQIFPGEKTHNLIKKLLRKYIWLLACSSTKYKIRIT